MTIQEMKKKKLELGYTYEQIAKLSGVPLSTVQKLFRGETQSPRYDTVTALTRLFEGPSHTSPVRESLTRYEASSESGQQGEYTLDDYYAVSKDCRIELIRGVIYDMTAPTTFHQLALTEIARQASNYILSTGGTCIPLLSPVDVQLDQDDRTMVQPDFMIVCDETQILPDKIFGAPDFVLEVISPGTRRRDYTLKLRMYEDAGVREYWIVDPYQKIIIVYFFESETSPAIYPIHAEVPVNIYNGKLQICLKRLSMRLPS